MRLCLALVCAVAVSACGGDGDSGNPSSPSSGPVTLTAPQLESPAADEQLSTLRPTLTVRNSTADRSGSRTYEFQISDSQTFTAATTSNVPGYAATVSRTGVPEGGDGRTSFVPDQDLQPTTTFYWRVRAVQGSSTGPWSATGKFRSKLVGFNRAGELYDPLIHGETIGEVVGSGTFIPGRGLQLNTNTSFVRYLLPQTVSGGEFSMDVEGLRANAPGDKAKVFGMQEGQSDFITNSYRIDIQYRGTAGFPPNAIQWRVLYGSEEAKYEPDTAKRFASVVLLDAGTTYHWRFTWGPEIRLVVLSGGLGGSSIYDYGMAASRGAYVPSPHYAYLGAPVGRSGTESASIAGTIYRNVWLSTRPRPQSLGSALR